MYRIRTLLTVTCAILLLCACVLFAGCVHGRYKKTTIVDRAPVTTQFDYWRGGDQKLEGVEIEIPAEGVTVKFDSQQAEGQVASDLANALIELARLYATKGAP